MKSILPNLKKNLPGFFFERHSRKLPLLSKGIMLFLILILPAQAKSQCPTITLHEINSPHDGVPYYASVAASPADNYTYTLIDGYCDFSPTNYGLPEGLTLDSLTGEITGTTGQTGRWGTCFGVRATDSNGCFAERQYSMLIYPGCREVMVKDLPFGAGGSFYFQKAEIVDANNPNDQLPIEEVNLEAAPPGITISNYDGTYYIYGTLPEGIYTFKVGVRYSAPTWSSCSTSKTVTLIIKENPLISQLPNVTIGVPYYALLPKYSERKNTYAIITDAMSWPYLPSGLYLNSTTGEITGTSNDDPGNYEFGIRVTDSNGRSVDVLCKLLLICPEVQLADLPNNGSTVIGKPYEQNLNINYPAGPLSINSISADNLPPGLNIKLSDGASQYPVIYGTPNVVGTYTFTVNLIFSYKCHSTKTYTMVVKEEEVGDKRNTLSAVPNTFTDFTTISYTVQRAGKATVVLYNVNGKSLKVLYNGQMNKGETKKFVIDEGPLRAGIYLVGAISNCEVNYLRLILNK